MSEREDIMRKGRGEEERSVRTMCDVCADYDESAAVGIDVDTQGCSLVGDETLLLQHQ